MIRRVLLSAFSAHCIISVSETSVVWAQENGTVQLDSIVVTANKREQDLAAVNGGVSVKSGEELSAAGVTKVDELGKVFPGLVIRNRGNRVYSNFTVRGQYSPDFYNASIQVYVDGVPQDVSVFSQKLIDVKRVEFLRGPQGTLYGRNAYGGVINIITKRARENRMSVAATATTQGLVGELQGTATLIPNSWFLDFYGRVSKDDGQIDDGSTGENNIDETRIHTGGIKLRYAPEAGPFDATFAASYDRVKTAEELYLLDQFVGQQKYFTGAPFFQPENSLDRTTENFSLNWNYKFENMTLSSTTAYQDVNYDRDLFGFQFPESKETFSQELKLNFSHQDRLNGVLGVYFQDDEFTRDSIVNIPIFGSVSKGIVEGQSFAVFGELTYYITPEIDITAGARYAYDKAEIDFNSTGFSTFGFQNSENFDSVQPKVSIGYKIFEGTRIYGLYSQGYKPGGFNHAVATPADIDPYKEETSENYEVGLRSSLFDNKLQLSVSAYYINSKDKQIYVGPVGTAVIRNVGEATSKGIEVEGTLQATEHLSFSGLLTVGKSEFDDYVDPITSVNNTGNRVPYSPDVTANISATYLVPQNYINADVRLYAGLQYTSEVFFDEGNTLKEDDVTLLDASLALSFNSGTEVKFFGTNLTDEIYRTYSYAQTGNVFSSVADGRVLGVTVKQEF